MPSPILLSQLAARRSHRLAINGDALSRRQVALVDSNSAPNHPHSLVELSPRSLASAGLRARAARCSRALSIAALEHPRVKCAFSHSWSVRCGVWV